MPKTGGPARRRGRLGHIRNPEHKRPDHEKAQYEDRMQKFYEQRERWEYIQRELEKLDDQKMEKEHKENRKEEDKKVKSEKVVESKLAPSHVNVKIVEQEVCEPPVVPIVAPVAPPAPFAPMAVSPNFQTFEQVQPPILQLPFIPAPIIPKPKRIDSSMLNLYMQLSMDPSPVLQAFQLMLLEPVKPAKPAPQPYIYNYPVYQPPVNWNWNNY